MCTYRSTNANAPSAPCFQYKSLTDGSKQKLFFVCCTHSHIVLFVLMKHGGNSQKKMSEMRIEGRKSETVVQGASGASVGALAAPDLGLSAPRVLLPLCFPGAVRGVLSIVPSVATISFHSQ